MLLILLEARGMGKLRWGCFGSCVCTYLPLIDSWVRDWMSVSLMPLGLGGG